SLELQILSSASRSNVPAVSRENLEICLYGRHLYSALLPVNPCTSIQINRLFVNINTSRKSENPSSTTSPSIKRRLYFSFSFSAETSEAFPNILLNKLILEF